MRLQTIAGLSFLAAAASAPACAQVLGGDFDKGGATSTGGASTTAASGATTSGTAGATSTSASSSGGSTSCKVDADCTPGSPCRTDICNTAAGTCVESSVPDGPVPGFVDMVKDCKTQKCVGGTETSVADDMDVPPSGNPCVTTTCANMIVLMNDAMQGTSCGTNQVCDGMGTCVGCAHTSDCAAPGTCKSVTCTMTKCIVSNDTAGATCNSGGGKVCNGMGACVGCVTNADCQSGNCANNTCGLANNGHACTMGSQCITGFCYGVPQVCQANSCGDGIKDGNETDVDCGGGNFCPRCTKGHTCQQATDCQMGLQCDMVTMKCL